MPSLRASAGARALGPLILALLAAGGVGAQERPSGAGREASVREWNSERALEVAEAAIRARASARADAGALGYRARAEGHVYFFGEFAGRRQLVRADQVALTVLRAGGDTSLQTIVGRRREIRLPTRIRYHIDHLGAVVDDLDDRIRLGEGDEVRDVPHPAAPGARGHYDYRLADSLEIRTGDRTVHVLALEVRPTTPGDPGLVGTIFVDPGSGGIARLAGTFTAASYVDPRLDHIRLDLRSALWEGRHWLPTEQELEIRRRLSWLSYPVGGIIRTRFRIFDHELGAELPELPPGDRLASLPPPALRAYDEWRTSLHAGPLEAGERDDEVLAALGRRARELARPGALAGSAGWQLHLPDASAAFRARRAEGALLGAGGRFGPDRRTGVGLWLGWPFARERPEARLDLTAAAGRSDLRASLFLDHSSDIGPWAAAAGLLSTLGFAIHGEDWTDPYFERGGEAAGELPAAGGRAEIALRVSRQVAAGAAAAPPVSGAARAVRPIREGTAAELRLGFRRYLGRGLGARWRAELALRGAAAAVGDFGYTRALARIRAAEVEAGRWRWSGTLGLGLSGGPVPPQRLLLLGGRATVPGYGFRTWGGDRAAWARLAVAREALEPWVRLRAAAAAGWTGLSDSARPAAEELGVDDSGGLRPAVGTGVGLFWDILRLHAWRGLKAGEWSFLLTVDPAYWAIL